MNRQILHRALVAVFFTALAGTATAQAMAAMGADDASDMKSSPTRAGGDTTPPPAPADAKIANSDSSGKAMDSSSKEAKPEQHAQAKSKSTTEKKSAHHVAKSTDQSTNPDEKAFRQALRGCATQQDQSQRDSCLDEAIEKFQRNT
ncbi:MAG TPA: hypothetical protein VLQ46_05555 [Casimicrobiaceae bacterium]|nr:hypothetical protein [Casimicrobiaceae bacterium]